MILATTSALILWSCSTFPDYELYIEGFTDSRPTSPGTERESSPFRDKVFIMYSMGYNNLSKDLNTNIDELLSGNIPSFRQDDDAILIFNHASHNHTSDYTIPTSPVLYHAYKMNDGSVRRDTLAIYEPGSNSASKEMLRDVLTLIHERFPANHYGMLVSSHATGWAPEKYCYNPPDKSSNGSWMAKQNFFKPLDIYVDENPLTRSIGAHYIGRGSILSNIYEIDLIDFVDAIPFHMDYMIFDCCLMGCIEVAYQLRNKCDKVCFSQTEILSQGMDYLTMSSHLFDNDEVNIEGIAYDYYSRYAEKPDLNKRSATISVVDCQKLDAVADVIKRNGAVINVLSGSGNRSKVQRYYRSSYAVQHGIFYDLEDILLESNAENSEKEALKRAIDDCIICKYATPTFLTSLKIEHHSGLSMYLIDPERTALNKYYTTLDWNKATGLIPETE